MKLNYDNLIKWTPARLAGYIHKYLQAPEQHQVDAQEYALDIEILQAWHEHQQVLHVPEAELEALWNVPLTTRLQPDHLKALQGTPYFITPNKTFFLDEPNRLLGAFMHLKAQESGHQLDVLLDMGSDCVELWSIRCEVPSQPFNLMEFIQHNHQRLHQHYQRVQHHQPESYIPDYPKQLPTVAQLLALWYFTAHPSEKPQLSLH